MRLPHERLEALERLCQAQQEFIVDLAARIAIFERKVFKPCFDGVDIDMGKLKERLH